MDENIYQMTPTEGCLILIVLGLWLFAVINLARKLERICNPPSILPTYSNNNKTSFASAAYNPNDQNQSSPSQINRATSEPTIDPSSRLNIGTRSPSETYLNKTTSLSENVSLTQDYELGRARKTIKFTHRSHFQIPNRIISNKPTTSQQLLNPKRIPSIVQRSLLDLHRRTVISNATSLSSMGRSAITPTAKSVQIKNQK